MIASGMEILSDADLLTQFSRSTVLGHLGTDEGFGSPFVEALRTGTIVVPVDQALDSRNTW